MTKATNEYWIKLHINGKFFNIILFANTVVLMVETAEVVEASFQLTNELLQDKCCTRIDKLKMR